MDGTMGQESDDTVLGLLSRLDRRTERMAEDVYELGVRMTAVEDGLAVVNRRIDRLEQRVDLIERRLEQVDLQH
jgi:cob(I)alamin adenosyltransferase